MIGSGSRFVLLLLILLYFMSTWIAAQTSSLTTPSQFHVGVILDLETLNGKMSHTCILMAVQDFYTLNDHYKTRLVLHTRDSKDIASAVSAAVNLLKDVKVQAIVGPQKSEQAQIVADLGNRTQVPVVSFSVTSPSLSRNQMPYFIRMTRNDAYQLEAIASVLQAFRWKEVVLIYEETEYGNGIIPYMNDLFKSYKIRVSYKSVIPSKAVEDQILKELHKLLAMQVRVFIVHISYSLAPLFFQKVNEVGLMSEGNAWIITEGLTNLLGSLDYSVIDSMQGVLGIKPYIPRSRELDKFRVKLLTKTVQESERLEDLNVFCLHAYDTIWALAMAAERVGRNHSLLEPNKSNNLADFAKVGISDVGPRLLKEILQSKFNGLSGVIHLDDGQLQPLVFQIINVVGHGEREIGFWIPAVGISQIPDLTTPTKVYKSLRPIIWPGESTMVPKGSMKKLKIGYLVKNSFSEFVKVELNFCSNGTLVTGYCIDVFKAVMEAIPYDIPYDFVPFEKGNSENESSYNHLVRQFHLQKYDAVVGDITVTSNRSLSVDFSYPYTTGGVEMLVPIKYHGRNLLRFFELFSKGSWVLCVSVFLINVLLIWFCEYARVSDICFAQQNAKILSIASMLLSPSVFHHHTTNDKKVVKFGVLTFVITFVILLVLTVLVKVFWNDNLEFTITEAKDLVKSGAFVGYQKGSYVKAVLKRLKFDESQLKAYNSPEEYDEALSKGSQNGGVAAVFDEIPYIKLFLNKYCGKYRSVGPIYKMEGFGFVFQKGSPLVLDVNRALLSVLEGKKIAQIETRWLGSGKTCPTPPERISSNIISLDKIWKLFIILYILFMLARINRQSDNPFWRLLGYFFEIDRDQLTKCEPIVADTSNGVMSPQVGTLERLWKTVDGIE